MVPLAEVYGTLAPLRSISGLVATSFSYNASVAAGMEHFDFDFGKS
jgi:hypothetical protein